MNRRERRAANELKPEVRDMKVVMTTEMCGPEGNASQGAVLDIPKDKMQPVVDEAGKETQVPMAEYMINKKFARAYDPHKDSKARQHGLVKAER